MGNIKNIEVIQEVLDKQTSKSRDRLIPLLQEIQDRLGFLSEESLQILGKYLDIPVSKIYGVATFYNQFRFQPNGKYHIQVCRGTACHVLGSATVLEELQNELKIKAGSTTKDGLFSIEIVACIGACGLAPVININGEFYAKVDSKKIKEIINNLKIKEE